MVSAIPIERCTLWQCATYKIIKSSLFKDIDYRYESSYIRDDNTVDKSNKGGVYSTYEGY